MQICCLLSRAITSEVLVCFPPTFYTLAVNLHLQSSRLDYIKTSNFTSEYHLEGTTFVSFSSFTSTLKLKTHSQLTQSPLTGIDCMFKIKPPQHVFFSLYMLNYQNISNYSLINVCTQQFQ